MPRYTIHSHIVDNVVTDINEPHPYENHTDETHVRALIERYLSNFKNSKVGYKLIKTRRNCKLFEFYYENLTYNIAIDHFDSGGSRAQDKRKKIGIPFSKGTGSEFMNLIHNFKPVLVINEYTFLKTDSNGHVSPTQNSIYAIVKPSEIYSSKCVITGNNSSRWVRLKDMLKAKTEENVILNHVKNVYIVPDDKLELYFKTHIIDEEYKEMTKFAYVKAARGELKVDQVTKLFRDSLIREEGMHCQFCNCHVKTSDLLVASHIEAKSNIKHDETISDKKKIKKMLDPNNGFMLCAVHDKVFDKKYITLTDDGKLVVSKEIINQLKEWNLEGLVNKKVVDVPKDKIKYLHIHQKQFLEKHNLKNLPL